MKRRRSIVKHMMVMVALGSIAGMVLAQTVESQNVVGFFKNTIQGAKRQLLTLPLHKLPVATGQIDLTAGTQVTDNEANFDDYSWGSSGHEAAGDSYFYLEVTTAGALEGRHWWITNRVDAQNLILADLADNLNGQSYKIVPARRIRDVFGEPGPSPTAILDSGISSSDPAAGKVTMWTAAGDTWTSPLYFHNNPADTSSGSSKNEHWIQGVSIVDDMPIDRDESFLVTRVNAADTNFVMTGEVSANDQMIVVEAGDRIFAGGLSVVDMPIGQSTITNAVGFSSGVSSSDPNATMIMKWVPAGDTWASPVYFHNNPADTSSGSSKNGHWIQGVTDVDASYTLQAGEGYMLRSPSNMIWRRDSPLN